MRDLDIRTELRAALRLQHHGDEDTVVVDELGLCQGSVRVDVAVVNGVLAGYEIKSPADDLRRLPAQVHAYGETLDLAAIVLTEGHADAAVAQIPDWWRVVVARPNGAGVQLHVLRDGSPNPAVNQRALAELIWHGEAMAILAERGASRGLVGKPRRLAWDRLCEVLSLDETRAVVRRLLKLRAARRAAR